MLFETATLRSGYQLSDTKAYGERIERMLRLSMNVDLDAQVHAQSSTGNTKWRCSNEVWLIILLPCPQVEEEPEDEPEEQTEEAEAEEEEEEEIQADEAEEESVSVETVTYTPSCCSKPVFSFVKCKWRI